MSEENNEMLAPASSLEMINLMDFTSKPERSTQSTIDEDIITLDHSYGYDCKKMYNLVLIDATTLVFASGNLIHFFNIETKAITMRRSVCGGGIGCIARNPAYKQYLTVAENGKNPTIFIYKFPQMEIISTLTRGTKQQYSIVDYTADGELLASQGGAPDYMLTIWDWKRNEIKLRAKSFSNDVANLLFSPYIPEQLTTCGLGHIKFWKMSKTFTGLKLQGLIGRFGKTEICDIYGMCPMPDEKVLSGCEWGNVLVWENGLVKVEVCRKNRRPCHTGPITQIFMCNHEEVMTVGSDGFIRIWYWETVELADPSEEDRVVEIEPSHEFRIGNESYSAELLKIVPSHDVMDSSIWYAQDGNGGIWWCDLSTHKRPLFPRQLFRCHAGEIVAIDTSSVMHYVCTLGADGRIYIYNYHEQRMLFYHQFPCAGRDLLWLPVTIDPTASLMIIGFIDGVIRMISFDDKKLEIQLVQAVKCHCEPITKISINPNGSIFVSAAEDSTIFVHQIARTEPFLKLVPIGFIDIASPVTCINWDPERRATGVFGCKLGEFIEVDLPELPQMYERTTYYLAHVPVKRFKFKSIKSTIKRNEKMKAIEARREERRKLKLKELKRMKKESPEVYINIDEFLADSDDEEVLDSIYVPDPPNKILWIKYTRDGTFWLSLDGYDAGYIYECCKESGELLSYTAVPQAEDAPMCSYVYLNNYCIYGMGDGRIRINQVKENWRDLSNYWMLSMHDNFFGKIPTVKLSYDRKFLFSIGNDGNLFSYHWNLPVVFIASKEPSRIPILTEIVQDILDPNYLSLEQQKEKENEEQQQQFSANKKDQVLATIAKLREEFEEILKKNSQLPDSQKLTPADLHLDDRITDDLQQKLDIQMEIVRRQKEFDYEKARLAGKKLMEHFIDPIIYPIEVIGIQNNLSVFSFRIKKLGKEFLQLKEELKIKKEEAAKQHRLFEDQTEESFSERLPETMDASLHTFETESNIPVVEPFLIGLSATDLETKLESKMRRLLNKYRERKAAERRRKKEWEIVNNERPNPDADHPNDIKMIEEAKQTIGDYKLKSDPNYEAADDARETVVKKLEEIIKTREDAFNIRNEYNEKVFALREKKKELIHYVQKKLRKLDEIHLELSEEQRIKPNFNVKFDFDREFPERNFNLRKYLDPDAYENELIEISSSRSDTLTPYQIAEKNLIELQRSVLQSKPSVEIQTQFSYKISSKVDPVLLKMLQSGEETRTEWEIELTNLRIRRRLFEQNKIIDKINARIVAFDNEIAQLSEQRYDVEVKAKFKEIFLLTLNQELMILKDFEPFEDVMMNDVDMKATEVKQLSFRLSNINTEIDIKKRMIEEMQDLVRKIEMKFKMNCGDSKFSVFLKRIFHRSLNDIEQTCEDEDDGKSEKSNNSTEPSNHSKGVVKMKFLDESHCPKGCDRKLYELAFQLRRDRYEHERAINTKQKELESILMEHEILTQKRDRSEADYQKYKNKLSALRHQKQKQLNNVDTIVMLKMDQMQYFKNYEEFVNIDKTLLFNNHNVTRLYSRVGKLALETIEAKRSHRINVIHLAKIKTDIKLMEKQIVDLKDKVNQAMLKKFGRVIDLNEIEETILRRFAFEMQIEIRANADDIKKQYANKINELKKLKIEKQKEVTMILQSATEKLNILTVLEEERNFLHKLIKSQAKKKELSLSTSILQQQQQQKETESDLDKLKEISNHQREQIEMLQREIRALSLKTKSFVDARQEFESLDYNIRQLHTGISNEFRPFEDSICSNADESMMSSTRATTPDEAFTEIHKMVRKFLSENLKIAEKYDIDNITANIAKYLSTTVINFRSSSDAATEEILFDVIRIFKSFLPISGEILKPESIATFIAQIIGSFSEAHSDENHLEILREIINNTIESANQTAISSNSYLQHIITEIFKMIIITLRIPDDINENECMSEIVERLARLNGIGISVRHVVIGEVVEDILDFAVENLEEGIDADLLRRIITGIIGKLS
ncbi:hypothetical protein PVAND_000072 [Polypedilum vanderplanki]|uniref:Cilia- and flagella-associated protein 44 n=1 Tax=Polypedilum vanderplanki TaxID=319348 RepID=A0A9J6BJQ2_POLVA|nr:hypothetical protein PVAND_000072 [Polypedilum vanderplanki]